jgi:hypothetical protein
LKCTFLSLNYPIREFDPRRVICAALGAADGRPRLPKNVPDCEIEFYLTGQLTAICGSWYYFSGQYEKDKSAERQRLSQLEKERHAKETWERVVKNTRRIESNARAGYHYEAGSVASL